VRGARVSGNREGEVEEGELGVSIRGRRINSRGREK